MTAVRLFFITAIPSLLSLSGGASANPSDHFTLRGTH